MSALADIDRQFDSLRATTQSGLATNEINQSRQDQASAAGVGESLARFTREQFMDNEARAAQSLTTSAQIPKINRDIYDLDSANADKALSLFGTIPQINRSIYDLDNSNANQAVSLFGTIPQLNLAEFQTQDNRANQAVTMAKQIPDMATQRMQTAIGMLNGSQVNPSSLLSILQGFQQQGINQTGQDSAFWSNLIATLSKQFGL
jgi:hypothetical protein